VPGEVKAWLEAQISMEPRTDHPTQAFLDELSKPEPNRFVLAKNSGRATSPKRHALYIFSVAENCADYRREITREFSRVGITTTHPYTLPDGLSAIELGAILRCLVHMPSERYWERIKVPIKYLFPLGLLARTAQAIRPLIRKVAAPGYDRQEPHVFTDLDLFDDLAEYPKPVIIKYYPFLRWYGDFEGRALEELLRKCQGRQPDAEISIFLQAHGRG